MHSVITIQSQTNLTRFNYGSLIAVSIRAIYFMWHNLIDTLYIKSTNHFTTMNRIIWDLLCSKTLTYLCICENFRSFGDVIYEWWHHKNINILGFCSNSSKCKSHVHTKKIRLSENTLPILLKIAIYIV